MTKRPLESDEEMRKKIRTGYENILKHSEERRKDKEFVLDAIRFDVKLVAFVDKRFHQDKEVMMEVVKFDGLHLQRMSPELRKDKDVVLAAVKQNPEALKFADSSMGGDKDICLAYVNREWSDFRHFTENVKNDREFMTKVFEIIDGKLKKLRDYRFEQIRLYEEGKKNSSPIKSPQDSSSYLKEKSLSPK